MRSFLILALAALAGCSRHHERPFSFHKGDTVKITAVNPGSRGDFAVIRPGMTAEVLNVVVELDGTYTYIACLNLGCFSFQEDHLIKKS